MDVAGVPPKTMRQKSEQVNMHIFRDQACVLSSILLHKENAICDVRPCFEVWRTEQI